VHDNENYEFVFESDNDCLFMQGLFNSTSFPLHNQYAYDLMKIY